MTTSIQNGPRETSPSDFSIPNTLSTGARRLLAVLDMHAIVSAAASDGTILYVNDKFCEVSGYSREELLGQNHRILKSGFHPQDFYDELWSVLVKGGRWQGELCNRRKDGSMYWVASTIVPFMDETGLPAQYISVRTNITELKQTQEALGIAESRYREAQRIARLGHWTMDLETGVTTWCDMVYELAGLDPAIGTPSQQVLYDLIHPDDLERFREMEAGVRVTPRSNSWDFKIIRPDGETRCMRLRCVAHNERVGWMMGTVQDVTEEKLRELELEQASRAKSEFLSRMSHELRTPMHAILGFAQLMRMEGNLAEEHADSVSEILRAGCHLLELINEVLDLSRIETGRQILSLQPVQMDNLLQECLVQVEGDARQKGLTLVQSNASASLWAFADRLRLRQVLLNLLSNAVKYNRKGGNVTVKCAVTASEWLRVSVIDTGVGIDEAMQADLFTPFNRLGQEGSTIEGTGIGLVIAKRFIEMMGGRIGVASKKGIGSTFWIEIPLVIGEDEVFPKSSPAEAQTKGSTLGPAKARRKIVYIEDNPANLRFMQQLLKRRPDITLLVSEDPFEGLHLVRRERPHLVLLDINLPGMDGYAVLKQLKADKFTQSIPVIAVSANAMLGDEQTGRAAGFDDYLTKPLDLELLMTTIERHVGSNVA
ncbi:MAG: ATP-binding protein [Pseudomonadota bacterium]